MGGSALCLALALLCLSTRSYSQAPCTLITPNVLRVDSEETVLLETHGLNAATVATITVYDFPQKKQNLFKIDVPLNNENSFMNTAKIQIPSKVMKKDSKLNQYVVLEVKSSTFQMEKVLLVAFQSGYIFIQTDKTIYTPGSTVYYRIFTVGHKLEPVDKTITVEFETPDGIIVKRDPALSEGRTGVISLSHKLPEIVNLGTWSILARYEDAAQQNFSTKFDVKEYVLPSFEVTIQPSENFFYIDSETLDIFITARFLYGKPVEGVAYVLFGIQVDDEKKSIPQSLRRIEIKDGEGHGTLKREMLTSPGRDLNELLGHSIFVTVTVLTDSGSDMVEAELTGIQIVTSPYKIHFTKTPKFFKPGMPFDLMVYVTNPDGSPAHRVPVETDNGRVSGTSQEDGTIRLTVNTHATGQPLQITVQTTSPNLSAQRQAVASMIAQPYATQTASKNYLHIGVTSTELKPGRNLPVNFHLRSNDQSIQNRITYFTYLILNKGKIIKTGRQPRQAGQNPVTMTLSITPDFIPSFRIVAYYYVENAGVKEIVADSIWVDVKDTCMGTLVVTGASERDDRIHEPGMSMKLKVKGDHKARVGFVAVDKGVYVLNKKHKISQSKVWDTVEKNDIGCTPGSGMNNIGVFTDAGLALETNFQISTPQRSDPSCPQAAKRKRRSVQLMEAKANKAMTYKDTDRKCCEDGMNENMMGYSCEKRSKYIHNTAACIAAFLDCCTYIEKLRSEMKRSHTVLGRSDIDESYLPEQDIMSRTEFPESWFWRVEHLIDAPDKDGLSTKTLNVFLKDSITTWEVLAVSLSENKGICVADPYEITVMKDFFIDLRMPYSVVRNEQVEVRAVLYNYAEDKIKVRVELLYNEAFCSASTAKKKYRQEIEIRAKSSRVLPFIIIPLQLGLHDIEVKAAVYGALLSDGVRKQLKVVPEGMKISKTIKSVVLDPVKKGQDGVQVEKVTAPKLPDIVPKTETETIVSVQGTQISLMVENSIDGANLKHLIQVPSGCGEQNMISMTPAVITTHYLDNTGQWEKLGVNRRAEAIKYIQQGYIQQLVYRKPDNSYAAFKDRASSTWLTAYIVKVFAMAYHLISIEPDVLCGAVKWLILDKQKPDGIFQEDAPVIHGEMVGGYRGAEPEASLTAFVLIALAESRQTCQDQVNIMAGSMKKAADFLEKTFPSLTKPYAVAITGYALTLMNRQPIQEKLMSASTGGTQWVDSTSNLYSIEATSYALLALLNLKKFDLAAPLVRWLTEQRYYGGGYGSTQATIMVYQALAQYLIDVPIHEDINMDVSIELPGRSVPTIYRINFENALFSRTAETKLNQDFTVKASGTGEGTLTVVTVYNALLADKEKMCKNFVLSVSVTEIKDPRFKKAEKNLHSVFLEVCTRFIGEVDSTMAILDISMMTGFYPDQEDLDRLANGVDKFISRSEIDKGNLIIYLDKVSHTEDECLKFRAHQFFEVGLIQPAAVKVYEYYRLENSCTKFYHPSKESGLLSKICQGDVCRCAEENCYMQQAIGEDITVNKRMEDACEPGVDYVYKVKLTSIEESPNYDTYIMTVVEIIKRGTDENPLRKSRRFISPVKCRDALQLKVNRDYLIWGLSTDLWDLQTDISYIISKDTWIEWWPNDEECQDSINVEICTSLQEFSESMMTFGCPT
ncbi:complement C3 [Microcaecilia unicolor]|uniref:Complement C3 n=1 Tax=Microcaecilia unicolor TaxID=1415580 RepID=A0A6P7XHQ8_9AMPH|nr:complement C3 [Microcaecilia unicolor]